MRFVQFARSPAATPNWGWVSDGLVWSGPEACSWLAAKGSLSAVMGELGAAGRSLTDLVLTGALPAASAVARAAESRLARPAERAGTLPGFQGRELAWPEAAVRILPPVRPTSLRDFYAFEAHVRNARARRGLAMLPEWYEQPVFYFSNHQAICGHGDTVARPAYTAQLDFELEVACVIGRSGRDIGAAEALDYVAGFTIMNDWSARDVQRQEMKVGLGPAKGKDFATSLGPYLVTPDELADKASPSMDGPRHRLTMTARVGGQEYSHGNLDDLYFTLGQMIARASAGVTLYPGDVIGSGTVGTGCILEQADARPWLEPGDVVELAVDRLGVLRNTVG